MDSSSECGINNKKNRMVRSFVYLTCFAVLKLGAITGKKSKYSEDDIKTLLQLLGSHRDQLEQNFPDI